MTRPTSAPEAVSTDESVLRVSDLTITAGNRVLIDHVSFTVGPRKRVGIIGASGSGKTITALAIAGLLSDELCVSGSVSLTGRSGDLVGATERALAATRGRLTGMVFQEPMTALNPTMRIDRQVAESLRAHRGRGRYRDEVIELLRAVELTDPQRISRAYPHQLSGGQRQRVVLAIALANNPRLLICDEPTTALDVSVQQKVLNLIDRRTAAAGSALLFISHDLAVVASICDYVLVMYRGGIVEQGPVTSVLAAPRHEHTRRLLADADLSVAGIGRDRGPGT